MAGLFGIDLNKPEVMQAIQLMTARRGEVGGLLGQFAQQAEQRKQRQLQEEMQRQQMEARQMEMEQMRRQQGGQEQMDRLAQTSFAPNQNLVQGDDEGNAMPSSGGGGLPAFAQGMMQIDPMKGIGLQQQLDAQNRPDLVSVAPGATMYDKRAQRPVFQAPEKTPDWKDPEYQDFMMKKARAGKTQVTTNVMPQREIFKDSMALKKDFDAQPEVKGFKEVQGAWDQISGALKDPSAANDLAAATKFMKMLDPGSVVRESELVMAMQASGSLDRFMNYANRIMTGQKLTPTQRQDFYSAGEALYSASKKRFGETVEQYDGIAKQYGLDPQFIPKDKLKALQKNMTATVKAREAIKRGADPKAVKQRLEEQGYDSSGI